MNKRELTKRYIVFLIGLYINSFGVSFVTKANLGTSPISSIPYVLSLGFNLTLGQFTILFSLLLIALQVVILGKKFQKVQLFQVPVSIAFGYFIDLSMKVLSWLEPDQYYLKAASLIIGCFILGFGVYLEVIADVVMLPGEAFVKAITQRFKVEFGTTKVCFDTSMTVIAGIVSIFLFHRIQGVREGTIIAALFVGLIARSFGKILFPFTNWLFPKQTNADSNTEKQDQEPLVITIAREYGSGGREIGKLIAGKLGIAYYDDELIHRVAKENGYSDEFVLNNDQKLTHSFLYDLYTQNYAYINGEDGKYDALFHAEERTIKEIAAKESCVIIGRLANFILTEQKNTFHVFICADMVSKVKRVMMREGLNEKEAEKKIKKADSERKNYCRHFMQKEWGMANAYDLSLKADVYGAEKAAEIIMELAK
ncbi:MAG: cytidylate kinase family protein [Hungatella sp.]|nr:cytidylate kinase family protein [Hungatella sp.]